MKQESRDARKVSWTCPHCSLIVANSTFKITNGQHKGKTLKDKHLLICELADGDIKSSEEIPVSSTEERVKKGEKLAELRKSRETRACPFKGCKKKYRGKSGSGFRNHMKVYSYRNQKDLGVWVIKKSRKFDFDM